MMASVGDKDQGLLLTGCHDLWCRMPFVHGSRKTAILNKPRMNHSFVLSKRAEAVE
jgi:hypothetical protein